MRRAILIVWCLMVILAASTGCGQLQKQTDYGTMTGGIPGDSPIGIFGSGKNVGP